MSAAEKSEKVPSGWDHVSASQISTFESCPRKWFFQSILKDREPPKPAQQLGTDIHAELEEYGNTGVVRPSEFIEYVKAALPFLPPPPFATEREFDLPTYAGGPRFTGIVDVTLRKGDVLRITDYKTSSDIRRYGKKPAELLDNVQMMSYAYEGLQSQNPPDTSKVELEHLYIQTRGAIAAVSVLATAPKDLIFEKWDSTLVQIRKMHEVAKAEVDDAMDVKPNLNACNDYGGCYYRSKCHGEKNWFDVMSQASEAKTDRGAKMEAANSMLAKRMAEKLAAAKVAVSVLPPDAPPRVQLDTPEDLALVTDTAPVTETALPKKGPGRPKKATEVATTIATAIVNGAKEVSVNIPIVPPPAKLSEVISQRTPTIYVDCRPTRGRDMNNVVDGLEWAAPFRAAAEEAAGVPDYRLVDFGKGKGLVIQAIRGQLDNLPDVMCLSSRSELAIIILEAISGTKVNIVKGMF